MSLLFNMLSSLVIAFLPRSKCILISWLQSPSAVISEPRNIKCLTVSVVSPSICHEMMGPDDMILVFWMLSFKPTFHSLSLSSRGFAFIKFFAFCHKGCVICISEVIDNYPGNFEFSFCFTSPAFLMIYSGYKLNKQGDNIQPWCTPFPIWNQSVISCPVLTAASWPAFRFLRRHVSLSGIPISLWIFHSFLWFTVKDVGIVS